jgi:pimeloyl-ACP methyl ester carboxylesterase
VDVFLFLERVAKLRGRGIICGIHGRIGSAKCGWRNTMATFVLVHGSMHGGWCWTRVVPLLRAASHEVFTPTLTGLGERVHLAHAGIDLDTHIQDVLGVLEYEDLYDVILVGHSSGAMVITGVADRAPGRIAHLVYLDGVQAADGQALLDFFPPDGQAARRARVAAEGDGWRLLPVDPAAFGVTDAADAAWLRAKLVPHPFGALTQPLRLANPAGFAGPKTYLACVKAAAESWRDAMVERARTEPGWRYREVATGHDAMITAPSQLAALLLETTSAAPTLPPLAAQKASG